MLNQPKQTERYLSDDSPDIVSRLLEKTGGSTGVRLLAILFILPAIYFLFTLDNFATALFGVPILLYSAIVTILLLSGSGLGWILCTSTSVLVGLISLLALPLMGGLPALLLFSFCTAMLVQASRRSIKAVCGISPRTARFTYLFSVVLTLAVVVVAIMVLAMVVG